MTTVPWFSYPSLGILPFWQCFFRRSGGRLIALATIRFLLDLLRSGEVFTLPHVFRAESEDCLRTPLGLNSDFFWLKIQPISKFRVQI
jgi:hypothetical protein